MASALFCYVTCGSLDEAKHIAKSIVTERLAACANMLPGMTSIYQWKGELCEDQEVVLIFKTERDAFSALEKRIKELHSYETPCIVAMDVTLGSSEYLRWIFEETRPGG